MTEMKKYVPLRDWASRSYDPSNGRAASSLEGQNQGGYSVDGQTCRPSAQLPAGQPGKGSPSWKQIDQNRCQGGTAVSKRPVG
jgi:hypothetical protein